MDLSRDRNELLLLLLLSPLAFGVPPPLLQGNKICNPRQGPLQGASQPNPGFFLRLLLLPLLLSQPDLEPVMGIRISQGGEQ
jgi:hypothetical protein